MTTSAAKQPSRTTAAPKRKPTGKRPKTYVLLRGMTLLDKLPAHSPGSTADQLRDALARVSVDYEVTRRTVERDLAELAMRFPIVCNDAKEPFRWYWSPHATGTLKRLAHQLSTYHQHTTASGGDSPIRWISADEFAKWMDVTLEEVIEDIQNGSLNGALIASRWHVLELAAVTTPDENRPGKGLLRVAANRSGHRLIAGSDIVEIAIEHEPPAIDEVVAMLLDDPSRLKSSVEVSLGGRTYEIDASLRTAIGSALMSWDMSRRVTAALLNNGAHRVER